MSIHFVEKSVCLWKNMYILWKSLYIRGEVYIYFIVKSIHTMGKFVPLYGISTPFKGKFICFGENLYIVLEACIFCAIVCTLCEKVYILYKKVCITNGKICTLCGKVCVFYGKVCTFCRKICIF